MAKGQHGLEQLGNLADVQEALRNEGVQKGPVDALCLQEIMHALHLLR